MASVNVSVYLCNNDLLVYGEFRELLNFKARESFQKELARLKDSKLALENIQDDRVHESIASDKDVALVRRRNSVRKVIK